MQLVVSLSLYYCSDKSDQTTGSEHETKHVYAQI